MADSGLSAPAVVARAEGRVYPELCALAAAEPADLFIGHYPVGLAAAAVAAERCGARLGYDIEDLYADTYPLTPEWAKTRTRILEIERRYVPRCAHLSAVSLPVAEAFRARYGSEMPAVVHNCHPWGDRQAIDGRTLERRGSPLSLFWFSQTVGLDRGLQDAIRAAGLSERPVQIHLRGAVSDDVRTELTGLASSCGLGDALHFHPTCAPQEILSRAVEHDVGLALETDDALNRTLTVTNKLFLYLAAGLAVAATDLPGQRGILESAPAAGALHRPGDVRELASHLTRWASDPDALAKARRASFEAARMRWNAETEAVTVVAAVAKALNGRGHRDAQRMTG